MITFEEAPVAYRGCIIHLLDEGGCFTAQPRLNAPTWAELKQKIDKELGA